MDSTTIASIIVAVITALGWLSQFIKNSKYVRIIKIVQEIYKDGHDLERFLNDNIVYGKIKEYFDDETEEHIDKLKYYLDMLYPDEKK